MAFGKKKSKEELTSGDLSAEFFGDGSAVTPGQNEKPKEGVGLFQAVTGVGVDDNATESADSYSMFDKNKGPVDYGPDYNKKSWFNLGGHDNPEVNPYAAEQDKRFKMDERASKVIRLVVLTVIAFVLAVIFPSASYNTEFSYSIQGYITCFQSNVGDLLDLVTGNWRGQAIYFKICAYLVLLLAGLTLATTGSVYQGALKNALVSPTTLGINSGSMIGVTLFALFAPAALLSPLSAETGVTSIAAYTEYLESMSLVEYVIATQGRMLCSLAGCLVVVCVVMLVSKLIGKGKTTSYGLIICGQVVALVFNAIVEMVRYYMTVTDETGVRSNMVSNNQGGITAGAIYTITDVLFILIPVVICFIIVLLLRNKLNLLAFKDEEARSMGIATERLRWGMIAVCTIMTAVVLSSCGNTAFVGLSVPLIVRRYIGSDLKYLIPASAAMGCLFMAVTYWLVDFDPLVAIFRINLPISVNLVMSVIGVILFTVTTIGQRRANRSADWI